MSLMLWEPLRRARTVNDFDRVVDDLFGTVADRSVDRNWKPATDLIARRDAYLFRFDLPGVSRDAIEIEVVDRARCEALFDS